MVPGVVVSGRVPGVAGAVVPGAEPGVDGIVPGLPGVIGVPGDVGFIGVPGIDGVPGVAGVVVPGEVGVLGVCGVVCAAAIPVKLLITMIAASWFSFMSPPARCWMAGAGRCSKRRFHGAQLRWHY